MKVSRHAFEFRHEIRHHPPGLFLERRRAREKRRCMPVVAEPEQNQIVPVNHFAALGRETDRAASWYSWAASCGSISPRIRATDLSGTAAGTKSDSRAIR